MKYRILIVCANYYSDISNNLLKDAKTTLKSKAKYQIINVPGVFEIPVVIAKNIKKYHGFIALGCVIKGETPHFNFISKTTIEAIMKLSVESKKPIGNGILTCINIDQATVRSDPSGTKRKGKEAVEAMLSVLCSKTWIKMMLYKIQELL